MDPLSALSVAASVVQLVDFASSLLSSTHEIYHSTTGQTESHKTLEQITLDLTSLNAGLLDCKHQTTIRDPELERLCGGCTQVTSQLLQALRKLRAQEKHTAWKSFRKALATIWTQGEITLLQRSLDEYRAQISMHALFSFRSVAFLSSMTPAVLSANC
jgi:hypothetical protein